MKDEKSVNPKIKSIKLCHRDISLTYCDNPYEFIPLLSHDVLMKSFPPDGEPSLTELDHFFTLTKNNEFVGFFRVIDLYFYGEIQLHGSYNKDCSFAIRAYFELGRIFIQAITDLFPKKIISSTVLRQNKPAQTFLTYLGLTCMGPLKDNDKYYYYIRK